ncbi:hypothetical protein ACJJTC_011250, partial [Scirpophaga incertulas]
MRTKNTLHRSDSTTKKTSKIQKVLEKRANKIMMRATQTLEQSTGLAIGPRRSIVETSEDASEPDEEAEAEAAGALAAAVVAAARHEQRTLLGLAPLGRLSAVVRAALREPLALAAADVERAGRRARRAAQRCRGGAAAAWPLLARLARLLPDADRALGATPPHPLAAARAACHQHRWRGGRVAAAGAPGPPAARRGPRARRHAAAPAGRRQGRLPPARECAPASAGAAAAWPLLARLARLLPDADRALGATPPHPLAAARAACHQHRWRGGAAAAWPLLARLARLLPDADRALGATPPHPLAAARAACHQHVSVPRPALARRRGGRVAAAGAPGPPAARRGPRARRHAAAPAGRRQGRLPPARECAPASAGAAAAWPLLARLARLLPDADRALGATPPHPLAAARAACHQHRWRGGRVAAAGAPGPPAARRGPRARRHAAAPAGRRQGRLPPARECAPASAGAAAAWPLLARLARLLPDADRALGATPPHPLAAARAACHQHRWRGGAAAAWPLLARLARLLPDADRALGATPPHPLAAGRAACHQHVSVPRPALARRRGGRVAAAGAPGPPAARRGPRARRHAAAPAGRRQGRLPPARECAPASAGAAAAWPLLARLARLLPDADRALGATPPHPLAAARAACHQHRWRGGAAAAWPLLARLARLLPDADRALGATPPHPLAAARAACHQHVSVPRPALARRRGGRVAAAGAPGPPAARRGPRARRHAAAPAGRRQGRLPPARECAPASAGAAAAWPLLARLARLLPDADRALGATPPHPLAAARAACHQHRWRGGAAAAWPLLARLARLLPDADRALGATPPHPLAAARAACHQHVSVPRPALARRRGGRVAAAGAPGPPAARRGPRARRHAAAPAGRRQGRLPPARECAPASAGAAAAWPLLARLARLLPDADRALGATPPHPLAAARAACHQHVSVPRPALARRRGGRVAAAGAPGPPAARRGPRARRHAAAPAGRRQGRLPPARECAPASAGAAARRPRGRCWRAWPACCPTRTARSAPRRRTRWPPPGPPATSTAACHQHVSVPRPALARRRGGRVAAAGAPGPPAARRGPRARRHAAAPAGRRQGRLPPARECAPASAGAAARRPRGRCWRAWPACCPTRTARSAPRRRTRWPPPGPPATSTAACHQHVSVPRPALARRRGGRVAAAGAPGPPAARRGPRARRHAAAPAGRRQGRLPPALCKISGRVDRRSQRGQRPGLGGRHRAPAGGGRAALLPHAAPPPARR